MGLLRGPLGTGTIILQDQGELRWQGWAQQKHPGLGTTAREALCPEQGWPSADSPPPGPTGTKLSIGTGDAEVATCLPCHFL